MSMNRFDKVKDPKKFRDVMKTCMEETRKGRTMVFTERINVKQNQAHFEAQNCRK